MRKAAVLALLGDALVKVVEVFVMFGVYSTLEIEKADEELKFYSQWSKSVEKTPAAASIERGNKIGFELH